MVLAASIFGAGFPVVAKKVKWVKVPKKAFFISKHFGTGVLIATAFVHVSDTTSRLWDSTKLILETSFSPRHLAT